MRNSIFTILLLAVFALSCGQGKKAEQFQALPFPDMLPPAMMTDLQDRAEYLAEHYWDGITDPSRNYPSDSVLVSGVAKSAVEQKFADWHWIYGHAPQASLTQTAKLSCGTVTIHLCINKGMIEQCCFEGDFLGNLPIAQLEDSLAGIAYERDAIALQLAKHNIAAYLDGVTAEELLKVMI